MIVRNSFVRAVGALVVAGGCFMAVASVALAHASLVRANIKPGQVFAHNAYPRVVQAFFAENVSPKGSFVHVFEGNPSGDHGLADLDNVAFPFKNTKEITVGLPRGLKGLYTVIWFTVSADDGHKAGNAYTFTVK